MTHSPRLLGALIALMGIAAAAPVGTSVPLERPAARVGDTVIWESDLDIRARGMAPAARAGALDEMIREELMLAEARRAGVTIDASEVQRALEQIK